MKRYFLLLLLSFSLFANAQVDSPQRDRVPVQNEVPSPNDVKPQKELDPGAKEQLSRGLNQLVQIQKQNEKAKKKRAMMNIALGVGFAVVLVIGLLRRRKK